MKRTHNSGNAFNFFKNIRGKKKNYSLLIFYQIVTFVINLCVSGRKDASLMHDSTQHSRPRIRKQKQVYFYAINGYCRDIF